MKKNRKNFLQANNSIRKQTDPKLTNLFVFLIILQSYFLPLIALTVGSDLNRYRDYLYLYTTISYTIIVLGIIIFDDRGLDVLKDHYSLWIIVIACFLAAVVGGTNNAIYQIFLVLLGLRLSVHLLTKSRGFRLPSLKSVYTGLLWSVGTIVIIALLLAFLTSTRLSLPSNLLSYILSTFLFEVAFVTVIEEALFRGLLFGILVMNGYEENKALFVQAVLFWGVHYLKLSNTPLFFIAIPLLTLSTTLITKKYKMLYLPIMIHTFANVLGPVLVVIIQNSNL